MGEVIIPGEQIFQELQLLLHLSLARAFPEFRPNSEFIISHLDRSLELDAKRSSHPVEVECPNADSVGQVSVFDNIATS